MQDLASRLLVQHPLQRFFRARCPDYLKSLDAPRTTSYLGNSTNSHNQLYSHTVYLCGVDIKDANVVAEKPPSLHRAHIFT
jgi:hypothetical protein